MGKLFVPLLLLWLCVSFWLIELCAVKTTDATIWEIFSWKYSVLCFTKRQRHVCNNMSRNTYSEKHSCWIETDGSAFRSPLIDVVVVVVWFSGSVLVVLMWNPDWHRWMCYSPLIVVVHVSCWQLPSFSFASSTVVGLIGNSLQPVEPVTQNKIYYKLVLSLVYFKLAQLQKSQHFPSYQQQILPCFVKAGCSASCSWMGLKNGT